tara:strand:+ start:157 stop:498 length:342 start_codon:yes stop_codon:yes gene_type:complete
MLNNYDGGYAKDDTDATVIFMYIKMTDTELEKALPLSYVKNSDCKNQYLIVIFKDGFDYLGQSTLDKLQTTIEKIQFKSILNNDYEFIKSHFADITETDYDKTKLFIQQQVNY